ncbi:hypothetical protein HHI36_018657 [Cryptolaemus montrouzieri]|uniref:Tight junction-associated protein 1 n=1 Tax=Cryptolaemus montrouzieri TaxID=559131 RepID=A0ABD2P0Z9_9CUCU
MINICKECGCTCKSCRRPDNDIHLHVEIENLKQKLLERDDHIIRMETNFLNESATDSDEVLMLQDEIQTWQDKYKRLSEAHKRIQRVNQGLEDKLLKLVDTCETDKSALTKDVAILSEKLAEANYKIKKLTESNERYKNDVNVAIQFLQCKQSNFVAHRFDSLPPEIQTQVSAYMNHKKKPEERKVVEPKSIKVPIPTFPPTAMFYSVPKSPDVERKIQEETTQSIDVVSAAIMAKVLEERQKERMCIKHCDTCTCSKSLKLKYPNRYQDTAIQTEEYQHYCKTCNDQFQTAIQTSKLSRTMDLPISKVPNFEHENFNNIVKVQPNNFLLERSSSNASSVLDLDVINSNLDSGVQNNASINSRGVNNNESSEARLGLNNVSKINEKSEIAQYQVIPVGKTLTEQNSETKLSMSTVPFSTHSKIRNNFSDKSNFIHSHRKSDGDVIDSAYAVKKVSKNLESENSLNVDRVQSDTSLEKSEENFETVDRSKYHEMEENVKRFLFKKTELWKQQSESYVKEGQTFSETHKSFSHTQTEI